jgi:hypothetical protein
MSSVTPLKRLANHTRALRLRRLADSDICSVTHHKLLKEEEKESTDLNPWSRSVLLLASRRTLA